MASAPASYQRGPASILSLGVMWIKGLISWRISSWAEISARLLVDYIERDTPQDAIQPGLKSHVIAIIFSSRVEKGTRACASTVFLHLGKLSQGNLRFEPGLKLST